MQKRSRAAQGDFPETMDGETCSALVAAASDVTVVVDARGTVVGVTVLGDEIPGADAWRGRRWVDTVTPETRGKVEALLRDATTTGPTRRRQVNHPSPDEAADVAVSYAAVRLDDGRVVAVGRDMRGLSALQQRLVETQQALERDYWRLRHVETRYRLLFQLSGEAMLVADAGTRRIVEANAAAARLFGHASEKLVGKVLPFGFAAESEPALDELLATARASGRAGDVRVKLDGGREVRASATCFRQDASTLLFVRLQTAEATAAAGGGEDGVAADFLERAPDGFVVTDAAGVVLRANRAFLDIAQLANEEHARGRSLGDWVGRPGADLTVFLTMLRKHEVVRLIATAIRGEHGAGTEVELSAVWAHAAGGPVRAGFLVRDVGRRVAMGPQGARDLTRAVEQLTGLVGRVSLRELIRDTTDLVERHFIEAALELTDDNRTAAAEVLRLSRQSLYVKLRRHSMLPVGEPGPSSPS